MASEKWLIDANALIEKKRKICTGHGEYDYVVELYHIEHAPTVDAVEVVHGRWLKRTAVVFDDEMVGYRCSECKTTWDAETNFCPNCGAKMDGDGND